jgi:hypothetical protein
MGRLSINVNNLRFVAFFFDDVDVDDDDDEEEEEDDKGTIVDSDEFDSEVSIGNENEGVFFSAADCS